MSMFSAAVSAAHTVLESLATFVTPLAGDLAVALAVVVGTLAVRLLISPLTYLQVRGERRRAALAPQIEKLREKHRDDPLALATETIAMQRAAGAGPFVSLLPGLAQAPFFILLFQATRTLPGTLVAGPAVFTVLLGLGAVLAWWSSRRMRRAVTGQPAGIARLLPLMPYLTVLAIAYLPLTSGIYLVTSTAWTALEHTVWDRYFRQYVKDVRLRNF